MAFPGRARVCVPQTQDTRPSLLECASLVLPFGERSEVEGERSGLRRVRRLIQLVLRIALAFRALLTLVLLLPVPGCVGAVYVDAESEWREAPSDTREFACAKRHLGSSFDG